MSDIKKWLRLKQLEGEELAMRQDYSQSGVRKQHDDLSKRQKYSARDEMQARAAASLQASRDDAAEYARTGVYPRRTRRGGVGKGAA
jgi:hypothetical protein